MPEDRVFPDQPATVRVGQIDGLSTLHRINDFCPTRPDLIVLASSKSDEGARDEARVLLPTRRISYVAFFKENTQVAAPDPGDMQRYQIGVPGNKRYEVLADPATVSDPVGFYGYPVSSSSLFTEVFFFYPGINYLQDSKPLGSMLVEEGLAQQEDIDRGLTEQAQDREVPLGQILMEKKNLDPKDIQLAVEQQRHNKVEGRPKRLGEIIVEAGLATEKDIEDAIAEQKQRRGKRLGEVLVEMGIVNEVTVAETLAKKFHLPFVNLDECEVDPTAFVEIPTGLIERYRVLPFATDDKTISIAMCDPLAMEALDMLRFSIGKELREVIVGPSQLEKHLKAYFGEEEGQDNEVDDLLQDLETASLADEDLKKASEGGISDEETSAVSKLVNRIILTAYRAGASDIHIEPNGPRRPMLVRFRVDGVCQIYKEVPAAYRSQLTARIKIMANLDITERRKPQDGKIKLRMGKRNLELRVATLPTVSKDEDVVLRILAASEPIPFDKLGLNEWNHAQLGRVIGRPYGLILAVGPTGSGKTTTLHSLLGVINTEDKKIWTAEDPVEITQKGLRQVQVHPKIGFDFAAAMRSFLRADPDVIMVGEMRDHETVSTGIEASLTGHLVFSTLHTNSAPETVTRLLDMELDPFTFSDALLGVLAQRLVRRLCPKCKEPYQVQQSEYEELVLYYGAKQLAALHGDQPLTLWRAPGCDRCKGEGYKGRMGIHELLVNDDDIRVAIQRKAPVGEVRDLAIKGGMRTLLQDGIQKCIAGHTSLRQVLAVCSR